MSKAPGMTARALHKETSRSAPAKPAKRRVVTMTDVARRVGVHQTTVSLALRNHPSIPVSTREKIRAAAAELGYSPHPLLDAFNFHRLSSHPVRTAPTIAVIADSNAVPFFGPHPYNRHVVEGARKTAANYGYRVELFEVGPRALSFRRLDKILAARGIAGVILSTFAPKTTSVDLDWDRFCAVKIECRHLRPDLDLITTDQIQATRLALQRLHGLGYRRVGLVACTDDETRLGEPFRTGLLLHNATLQEEDRVSPLMFDADDAQNLPLKLNAWAREQQVEAVISNWNNVPQHLQQNGWRIPEGIAFATLDKVPGDTSLAGVEQNHALVGHRAVEQLAILLQTSRRGVPEMQTVMYVPGVWREGPTAPPNYRKRVR
jgi:LacI family transcriptional regulator